MVAARGEKNVKAQVAREQLYRSGPVDGGQTHGIAERTRLTLDVVDLSAPYVPLLSYLSADP